jgi:hypothetical protein
MGSSSLGASSSETTMGASSYVGDDINSFGTNNHEAYVDEADAVQSDGTTGTIRYTVV